MSQILLVIRTLECQKGGTHMWQDSKNDSRGAPGEARFYMGLAHQTEKYVFLFLRVPRQGQILYGIRAETTLQERCCCKFVVFLGGQILYGLAHKTKNMCFYDFRHIKSQILYGIRTKKRETGFYSVFRRWDTARV